jgi:hypothetical protein
LDFFFLFHFLLVVSQCTPFYLTEGKYIRKMKYENILKR